MPASAIARTLHPAPSGINTSDRKPAGKARETATRSRCHDVPGTLMPSLRGEIVGSLRAGRSVEQTRKEYNCTAAVALELWLRDVERRLAVVMRPAAMTASLLVGLCVADAWEYARHDDGGATIQRAFRTRRVRKSRRDGEVTDSVWSDTPAWAA